MGERRERTIMGSGVCRENRAWHGAACEGKKKRAVSQDVKESAKRYTKQEEMNYRLRGKESPG